ncbi:AraC family transcriptional regulator [Tateyamaria omphalii]|uniref:AraC family transcriptional regulator n=1 Tax=Tateyamaria omphalii TaxID=299262 RepID=UPI0021BD8BE9|nr:AraC family transcriptional regulator [Tateyamaria omphalii]
MFETSSVDEARATVARKFCDHRLEPLGKRVSLSVTHNHAAGRAVSLNYIRYGGDVLIDPGALRTFYLVQVPVAGQAHIRHRGSDVFASTQVASVLNPDRTTQMVWSHDCAKLLMQIDKAHLERVAQSLIGRELPGPIRFEAELDMQRAGGALIRRQMVSCAMAIEQGRLFSPARMGHDHQIETQLALALLTHQRSNITHMIDASGDQILPAALRRAVDYIHANLIDPIDLTQIANAADVNVRTLQLGFRANFGLSPMQYVKSARLDMAHYMLIQGQDPVSVTDAAYSCGFSHLGRFSRDYKARFGKPPSHRRR